MKKTLLLVLVFFTFQSIQAQSITFDKILSNQGYDKSITFDMNSGLGIQAYRFISQTDKSLQLQSFSHNIWATTMTVDGGKVGIGTTSPEGLFDVDGTAFMNKQIIDGTSVGPQLQIGPKVPQSGSANRVMNFIVSGTYSGFDFFDINGNLRLDYDVNTTYSNIGMRDHNNNEIYKFAHNDLSGSYLHMPQADSRIVIGDYGSYLYNEGYKFVVKDGDAIVQGTLVAEEVIVSLSIPPDFVFEQYYKGESNLKPDYVMPTLQEVAKYTKENHHLPELPSAREIQKNGLSVSEMSGLLLQKIEELTLYTIEQEERIIALENKLQRTGIK